MFTPAAFLTYTQWAGIATLAFAAFTVLCFVLQWGFRFRMVGVTGFMLVLTSGLFGLSIVPFSRTVVPGAVRFTTVYDSGATEAVIVVPETITEAELTATLQQAASDLFSFGRLGGSGQPFTIRARAVVHPEPGVSQPRYLGQIQRSLQTREDDLNMIDIFRDNLVKQPPQTAPALPQNG